MEDFITYELAVKLKEKGFKTENTDWCYLDGNLVQVKKYVNISPYEYAPTISQVLKWLRKEYGIFILVEPDILSPEYKLTFTLRVKFYIKGEEDEGFSEKYLTYRRDSYELAALAGVSYCLDNLI